MSLLCVRHWRAKWIGSHPVWPEVACGGEASADFGFCAALAADAVGSDDGEEFATAAAVVACAGSGGCWRGWGSEGVEGLSDGVEGAGGALGVGGEGIGLSLERGRDAGVGECGGEIGDALGDGGLVCGDDGGVLGNGGDGGADVVEVGLEGGGHGVHRGLEVGESGEDGTCRISDGEEERIWRAAWEPGHGVGCITGWGLCGERL